MKKFFAPFLRGMNILAISIRRYSAHDRNSRAVALTFYTLFAIVPLAALLFGQDVLLDIVDIDPNLMYEHVEEDNK